MEKYTIAETMLHEGEGNAIAGSELAAVLGCDIRDITLRIEDERRRGYPICANTKGYFMPANADELQIYCNRLHRRAAELYKTRQSLLKALEAYRDKREAAEHGESKGQ